MKFKLLSIITVLSLILFSFSACKLGQYGEDFTNVKWSCDDPKIEFTILNNNDCGFGYIVVNNQNVDIFCQWLLNKKLIIYRVDDYPENFDFYNAPMGGNGILSFSYKISDNKALLEVLTDEIFNFKYTSLTITYKPLD